MAGGTRSYGRGDADVLLINYDSSGAVAWAKTWGGEEFESARAIEGTADNQVCVLAVTSSYGAGKDDILLLKYRINGELLWAKTWGTAAYERAASMAVDTDGNMYVCGSYLEWGGKDDVLLCRFDPEGEIQWAVTWGGDDYDYARDVAAAADGVYVCGNTYSFGAGGSEAFVLRFSSSGLPEWAEVYGGEQGDVIHSMWEHAGTLYAVGNTRSFGEGDRDALLMALELDGAVRWALTWGTSASEGLGSLVAEENSLIAVGSTDIHPGGGWDILLLRFGFGGDLRSSKTWGAQDVDDIASALSLDASGDLYIGGTAENIGGQWQSVEGAIGIPVLQVASAQGVVNLVSGQEGFTDGAEAAPNGVNDVGGGGEDALVLKNYPR